MISGIRFPYIAWPVRDHVDSLRSERLDLLNLGPCNVSILIAAIDYTKKVYLIFSWLFYVFLFWDCVLRWVKYDQTSELLVKPKARYIYRRTHVHVCLVTGNW